ncbi:RteC domain-containing protein [Sinomicrobium kalidii]|uniref:RteC domain-containing protein n=1 Tax=Sinomicrobium kalidii TaxID=2900738 RepID=UPI001E43C8DD|nr:RteC domain-containing protein [Sinomicrobium kalidii]UGU15405.1 RteC domain-containing protein [Sinomicrobium kalidii]
MLKWPRFTALYLTAIFPLYLMHIPQDMVFKSILTDFNRELQHVLPVKPDDIKQIHRGIHLSRKTLYRLRDRMKENTLGSEAAEIRFFKEVKVIPLSWMIYFTEAGSLELRKPRADAGLQTKFFKKQLHKAEKFFRKHRDFIFYMEQGYTHLDRQYFTRNTKLYFPFPFQGDRDPDFSTSHDLLWARILAMNRFVDYLKKTLHQNSPGAKTDMKDAGTGKLVWTLPKTAAVELLYALYHSGAFNHGNVELKDVVHVFEKYLHTDLGNFYTTFSEIRARKIDRTKYMDLFTQNLLRKIEEGDL